jgi:hypothetical protein
LKTSRQAARLHAGVGALGRRRGRPAHRRQLADRRPRPDRRLLRAHAAYQRSAEAAAAPISDDDRSAAIERATNYADAHGINTIYVVV